MPKVNFVKKARKDNPVVKKGESYYWWAFRFGGKHYSKTQPRASQLTQSEFLSQAYSLNERIEDLQADSFSDMEELQSEVEEIKDEFESLGEETEDKYNNMPDQLQEADTGCLLQERFEECQEIVTQLESIDFDCSEDTLKEKAHADLGEGASEEDLEAKVHELMSEMIAQAIAEVQDIQYSGS